MEKNKKHPNELRSLPISAMDQKANTQSKSKRLRDWEGELARDKEEGGLRAWKLGEREKRY